MRRISTLMTGHFPNDQLAVNGIDTGVTVKDVLDLADLTERLMIVAAQWRALVADEDRDERRVAQVERDHQALLAWFNRR